MSINIYLNTEKLENHKDFEKIEKMEKGHKWYSYRFLGDHVFRDEGRYYIISHEIEEDFSELIEDMVEEVSFYEQIPLYPERIMGVYVHKSATATVDIGFSGRKEKYAVKIRGKKMEDVRELYRLIRNGKILPKESWEQEQMEKPSEPKVKVPAESDPNLRDALKPMKFSEFFKMLIAFVQKIFRM